MDKLVVFSLLACLTMATVSAQSSPKDYVDAHNGPRAEVGSPPMVWNETLVEYAQAYANKRIKGCELEHSEGPYGENLAMASWDLTAKEAVDMWYDEKKLYDVGSNKCTGEDPMGCYHYTQVVWKDSVRVGCAKVQCANKDYFVICNYDPPGNYEGERPF